MISPLFSTQTYYINSILSAKQGVKVGGNVARLFADIFLLKGT